MKKIIYFCMVLFLVAAAVAPAAAAPTGEDDQPPQPAMFSSFIDFPYKTYLPVSPMVDNGPYDVSGVVMDMDNLPVTGVSVTDGAGHTAQTNLSGEYTLRGVGGGQRNLRLSKSGYNFYPGSSVNVNVNRDLFDQNFTASLGAPTDTVEKMQNTSFEINYWWNAVNFMDGNFPAHYSRDIAYSGLQSAFTGVPQGAWGQNGESISRYRSQEFLIPPDATAAELTMQMWPATNEVLTSGKEALKPSRPLNLNGLDVDAPESLEVFTQDWHFVVVTIYNPVSHRWEWFGEPIILELNNSRAWNTVTFDLLNPTVPWPSAITNRWLKLEFGTINQVDAAKSWAYFDDVSLLVTSGGGPGPVPSTCTNILLNSDMEGSDGWVALPVQPTQYPVAYATTPEVTAHSLLWAFRTGIPFGVTDPYAKPQWGEMYQAFTIPANATSASLSAWLKPVSTFWGFPYAYNAGATLVDDGTYDATFLQMNEMQYVYLMGPAGRGGPGQVDHNLLKWYNWNSAYWLPRSWDITAYRGQNISVLFGAANDGWGPTSGLYVDDVTLTVCAPTAPTDQAAPLPLIEPPVK